MTTSQPLPWFTSNDALAEQQVVVVASALNQRISGITRSMSVNLSRVIIELGDVRLFEILSAAVEGNVETILHILQHEISPEHVTPPAAAFEHARRLAQNRVPLHALVRAYRLGQDFLLREAFDELERSIEEPQVMFDATKKIVSMTFSYIDWISQEVIAVYEEEQAEQAKWLGGRDSSKSKMVRDIISGKLSQTSSLHQVSGYLLDQHHLAVIAWTNTGQAPNGVPGMLDGAVKDLEGRLGCPGKALVVPCDMRSIWAWLPLGRNDPVPRMKQLAEELSSRQTSEVSVALGGVESGLTGFRNSHWQAVEAQRLSSVAGHRPPFICYSDPEVRAAATLCSNLAQTKELVRAVLGPLATDDTGRAQLRESLLTFLSTSCNYTATADLLSIHKNSVRYRVAKAQQERGASVDDTRLDLELALVACRWFGSAVLLSPSS